MKRIVAFTLMLVLVLACLAPAIAANNQLSAASHGGKAQSGYVEKINIQLKNIITILKLAILPSLLIPSIT